MRKPWSCKKLRNTMFYTVVGKAIEDGELTRENIREWVIKFNRWYDDILEEHTRRCYRMWMEEHQK